MGKKKKLIILAVVLIVGITTTVFAMPGLTAIIQRMSMSDSEQAIFDDLARMTTEEIIDEMNVLLNETGVDDSAMYHAIALFERLDAISGEYLLDVACDDTNHTAVRYTMLQLYSDKLGSSASSKRLFELILDETEEFRVRTNAVASMPCNAETEKLFKGVFFNIDEDVSYHVLKYLYQNNSLVAEDLADTVLKDYLKYSPQKISIALTAKSQMLLNNTANRTYDELLTEKEIFTEKAIEIFETYPKSKIPKDGDTKLNFRAANPALSSGSAMAYVQCEAAVRYMLMEFPEKCGDEYASMSYLSTITVTQNGKAIARLAKESNEKEDLLLVAEAIKICPFEEFVEPLKNKMSVMQAGKNVKIDSEQITAISDVLKEFDDGFVYTPMPDTGNYIDSWRW